MFGFCVFLTFFISNPVFAKTENLFFFLSSEKNKCNIELVDVGVQPPQTKTIPLDVQCGSSWRLLYVASNSNAILDLSNGRLLMVDLISGTSSFLTKSIFDITTNAKSDPSNQSSLVKASLPDLPNTHRIFDIAFTKKNQVLLHIISKIGKDETIPCPSRFADAEYCSNSDSVGGIYLYSAADGWRRVEEKRHYEACYASCHETLSEGFEFFASLKRNNIELKQNLVLYPRQTHFNDQAKDDHAFLKSGYGDEMERGALARSIPNLDNLLSHVQFHDHECYHYELLRSAPITNLMTVSWSWECDGNAFGNFPVLFINKSGQWELLESDAHYAQQRHQVIICPTNTASLYVYDFKDMKKVYSARGTCGDWLNVAPNVSKAIFQPR